MYALMIELNLPRLFTIFCLGVTVKLLKTTSFFLLTPTIIEKNYKYKKYLNSAINP